LNRSHLWSDWTPNDVGTALRDCAVPWWIAGGWALDLVPNAASRAHSDIDISCFRDDCAGLRTSLPGWEFYGAHRGELIHLDKQTPVPTYVHGLWCRPQRATIWHFEVLIEEREAGEWVYRRNRDVRRAVPELCWREASGLSVVRPEVQLLYKSKNARPNDVIDFRRTLPLLDRPGLVWLREALNRTEPSHAWLAEIEEHLGPLPPGSASA
jgi:hypothetical protein